MKNKQKSILIRSIHPSDNKTLNGYLDKGWEIKQIAPLGHDSGNALVIIEEPDKKNKKKPKLGFGGKGK